MPVTVLGEVGSPPLAGRGWEAYEGVLEGDRGGGATGGCQPLIALRASGRARKLSYRVGFIGSGYSMFVCVTPLLHHSGIVGNPKLGTLQTPL